MLSTSFLPVPAQSASTKFLIYLQLLPLPWSHSTSEGIYFKEKSKDFCKYVLESNLKSSGAKVAVYSAASVTSISYWKYSFLLFHNLLITFLSRHYITSICNQHNYCFLGGYKFLILCFWGFFSLYFWVCCKSILYEHYLPENMQDLLGISINPPLPSIASGARNRNWEDGECGLLMPLSLWE